MMVLFKDINQGDVEIFDFTAKTVLSSSMEQTKLFDTSTYEIKSLKRNELIVIKKINDFKNIKVGDVLTFKYVIGAEQKVITHRVIKIDEKPGGYLITLKGDNVNGEDNVQIVDTTLAKTSYNYIIGKVVWSNYFLGIVITILKTKIGIVFTVITPSLFLIIYEIYKLGKLWRESRKNSEIMLLQERIKELEGNIHG
jgi:signal peptidase I